MNEDLELEEQMKMLEGMSMENDLQAPQMVQPTTAVPVQQVVQEQVNQQVAAQVVQPSQTIATPVQPIQQVANPVANPVPPQPQVNMNRQPVFVNLNNSTYTTKTDFFNLKKEEKTRITLVGANNFQRVFAHYIDGLGWFKCLSQYNEAGWVTDRAICCMELKKDDPTKYERAKTRLLVPIIEYPVSRTDGKTIIQGQPKLKMWNMNILEEKALMEVLTSYATGPDYTSADVTTFDLYITVDQTSKFPVKKMSAIPSIRNQFGGLVEQEIAKIDNDFYMTANDECAKTLPEEKIAKAMNAKLQAQQMANQLANQPIPDANAINLTM